MFAARKQKCPPFTVNTRVYSCTLIRNDIPFRWRSRQNEDTDINIRVLKAGWCTVQFNAFLQWKMTTQTIPGGCTEEFYRHEGTTNKSKAIVKLHPDICRLVIRFGRVHHYCDYSGFRTPLIRKDELNVGEGVNDYGMKLLENCPPISAALQSS
jgi:hypothetical protein